MKQREEILAPPPLAVSVERGTDAVPDDDRYHLTVDGEIVFSSRSRPQALSRFRVVVASRGGYQTPAEGSDEDRRERIRNEDIERDLMRTELYWSTSSNYASKRR